MPLIFPEAEEQLASLAPHPALRATFSRKREKGFFVLPRQPDGPFSCVAEKG